MNEFPSNVDYPDLASTGWGAVPIEKGSRIWRALRKSIGFTARAFDGDKGGFAQQEYGPPTLWATRMGVESLWWSEHGLAIDDAFDRFYKVQGREALGKTVDFLSANYVEGKDEERGNEVGGFIDPQDGVGYLGLGTTLEGLKTLVSLETMAREMDAVDRFLEMHPNAMEQMLRLTSNRWSAYKGRWNLRDNSGGFKQIPSQSTPDVWGTFAALEIGTIASARLIHTEEGRPQATEWVANTKQRIPQIVHFLDDVQTPSGGFGFSPESDVVNILSTNQAALILNRLSFYDEPAGHGTQDALTRFLRKYKAEHIRYRMLDCIESMRVPGTVSYVGVRLGR